MTKIKLGGNSRKEQKKEKISSAWLHFLWATLVKALAGFRSEISGSPDNLQAHHLAGKPNLLLRYIEMDNGICVTSGEHNFGFHHAGNVETYRGYAKKLRGEDVYERLALLKPRHDKISLVLIEEKLLRGLAPFSEKIYDYYLAKDYKSGIIKAQYNKLFVKLQSSTEGK